MGRHGLRRRWQSSVAARERWPAVVPPVGRVLVGGRRSSPSLCVFGASCGVSSTMRGGPAGLVTTTPQMSCELRAKVLPHWCQFLSCVWAPHC
ncbi:hypothetical protein SETIT_8G133200v2 [Setaria italica]|uniref:Uncharacterized protein n=1 Tax=Setaria italica TaxID=4555 RepID=A0A368S7J8_SETIT|nr:hypothetical protein SETIT_8G133200v2 [Setaria italica]